jgi:hypothetical protein
MVTEKTRLPVVLEVPGMTIQSTDWNGMAALYVRLSAGADFTPVLKGLADDLCSCPHWGYVTKGAIYLKYKDGSEEIARAGDLWHTPPGIRRGASRTANSSSSARNTSSQHCWITFVNRFRPRCGDAASKHGLNVHSTTLLVRRLCLAGSFTR